jgi:CheY-like chemotaxis protein
MTLDIPRVLVFDDSPVLREDLAESLRERGFEVDEYDNPNAAIMAVNSKLYSAAVLDIVDKSHQPGGLAVADQLREVNKSAGVFMVSVHGRYQKEVKKRGLPFYIKPVKSEAWDEICTAIKESLVPESKPSGTRILDVIATVEECDESICTVSYYQTGVGWLLVDLERSKFPNLVVGAGGRIRISCIVDQAGDLRGFWIPNSSIINNGEPEHSDYISSAQKLEPLAPDDFHDAQKLGEYRERLITLLGKTYDT